MEAKNAVAALEDGAWGENGTPFPKSGHVRQFDDADTYPPPLPAPPWVPGFGFGSAAKEIRVRELVTLPPTSNV